MYENRAILIGCLGKDAELKTTKAGSKFVLLSLATQTSWQDKNEEWQKKTEWHRLVVWGEALAEFAAKLKKGAHVYVDGMLVSNQYEKKVGKGKSKDTVKVTSWQIKVRFIRNLRPAKEEEDATVPVETDGLLPAETANTDIPF